MVLEIQISKPIKVSVVEHPQGDGYAIKARKFPTGRYVRWVGDFSETDAGFTNQPEQAMRFLTTDDAIRAIRSCTILQ